MQIVISMLWLIGWDTLFILMGLLVLLLVGFLKHAAFAVMKRNFIGYFSNPTGYVFLCLFVLLTSFAAFWPHEFFNSNLANLDQLSMYLPFIMLIFVPAITMSTWAEEKRQGTDELLLTLPADDFDIVIGKYLAAAAIFSVSLLFSQLANYWMLVYLTQGNLDSGLLLSTYFGYWMIGMAMLSIGMVASFLTNNLTVSFVLGIALNAPLVFAVFADTIIPNASFSRTLANCSLTAQSDDFAHGVISISSISYFFMVIAIGLYISMVLIGKRHWSGGRDGQFMLAHYLGRAVCLAVILLGMTSFFYSNDLIRVDVSEGQVSSLAPDTRKLISELEPEYPIVIDVFVSREVPEDYVQTKRDLISRLKALRKLSGADIRVNLNDGLEPFSEEAKLAETRFNITPMPIQARVRGKFEQSEVIMGAAFKCGLEKVVVPFFDYGIPVEYELVRSIATVAYGEKKRLGIVTTGARLMGGFDMSAGFRQIPKSAMVSELEKQYRVDEVNMSQPVAIDEFDVTTAGKGYEEGVFTFAKESGPGPDVLDVEIDEVSDQGAVLVATLAAADAGAKLSTASVYKLAEEGDGQLVLSARSKYDVLMVVQPSSLGPPELANLILSIKKGIPTAIFEDPRPLTMPVPATGEPNPRPGGMMAGMMGGGGQAPPKGNIRDLWRAIGVTAPGTTGTPGNPMAGPALFQSDIVWQRFNPYKKLDMSDDNVFIRREAPGAEEAINGDHPITKGIEEVFFPAPGAVEAADDRGDLEFTKLLSTGDLSGTMKFTDYQQFRQNPAMVALDRDKEKTIAAYISGKPPVDDLAVEEESDDTEIEVVYVADLDVMYDQWVLLRARPDSLQEINLQFENITFMLNVIDALSSDDDYIDIRTRKPRHATLTMIEAEVSRARDEESKREEELQEMLNKEVDKIKEENAAEDENYKKQLEEIEARQREEGTAYVGDRLRILQVQAQKKAENEAKLERKQTELNDKLQSDRKLIRRDADLKISNLQTSYKLWAVAIPPLLPMMVGLVVFVYRRLREREGVSTSRLR